MNSRRKFFRSGLGLAGIGMTRFGVIGEVMAANAAVVDIPNDLRLGIAGYTFLHIPMDQGIAMMKRMAIEAMSIKDFYLPLNSGADKIAEVVAAFRAAGIRIYGAGVIYM